MICFEWASIANQEVESLLPERDVILEELRYHLHRAQHKMKVDASFKRKDVQWNVGEFVYIELRPYRQSILTRQVN